MGLHLIVSGVAMAQEHVVPPSELRDQMRAAAQSRRDNLEKIDRLMNREAVKTALKTAKIDDRQVRYSATLLSDEELARLADRAAKVDRDLAAGALNNQELTYIVIALATAVIVIVILKA